MRVFEDLSMRGQLGRLRRLAEAALAFYEVRPVRLVLLAHVENTIFRVEAADGERFVLRIHRTTGSPAHPPRNVAEVRSEMIWLSTLGRDAGLAVPEPVPTADGALLTVVEAKGVPEPRICVLLRWGPGRFLNAGLTASHLERVGGFVGRLHDQAIRFAPPVSFERWRIGDISEVATYATDIVGERCGSRAVSTVRDALSMVEEAQQALGTGPDVFGLIHGDLHQENYLFHRGRVRAIDFDDSGWGCFAYDLAVVLSELHGRPDYAALRAGLLRGYRGVRPLPADHEQYLEILQGLRLVLLTLWILEQREHPAFADWETEVREGLADLATLLGKATSLA